MANEFQFSSLSELFDSTLYKLPTEIKVWCMWGDNDCRTTESEQYNFYKTAIYADVTSMTLGVCDKNIVVV